jgi:hypothetical protein
LYMEILKFADDLCMEILKFADDFTWKFWNLLMTLHGNFEISRWLIHWNFEK